MTDIQTGRQPRRHSKCSPNTLRRAAIMPVMMLIMPWQSAQRPSVRDWFTQTIAEVFWFLTKGQSKLANVASNASNVLRVSKNLHSDKDHGLLGRFCTAQPRSDRLSLCLVVSPLTKYLFIQHNRSIKHLIVIFVSVNWLQTSHEEVRGSL